MTRRDGQRQFTLLYFSGHSPQWASLFVLLFVSNWHGKSKEYDVCLTTHPPPPYVLLFSRSLHRCVYCEMFKINVRLLGSPEIATAVTKYTTNMQQMRTQVKHANMVAKSIYTFFFYLVCFCAILHLIEKWWIEVLPRVSMTWKSFGLRSDG